MSKRRNLDAIIAAYIACAIWSSTDENDVPLNLNYDEDDVAEITHSGASLTCAGFLVDTVDLDTSAWSDAQLGHDLWLTRNHHGAGFWDRGHGPVGEELTRIAEKYGERSMYVGDDGMLYWD